MSRRRALGALLLAVSAIAASRMAAPRAVAAGQNLPSDLSSGSSSAKTKVNPKDGLTYVWIAAGKFQMGCSPGDVQCSEDETLHLVTLTKGFWIGRTLVTQAAYKKVVGYNPSKFRGDSLPVDMVSWDDAKAYCERVDMRLPSEAEWEFAARGGGAAKRGALNEAINDVAWYNANSRGTTHEVAQKQANGYGLYDMLGNLWEWVADWYGPYGKADAVDPKGPADGAVRVLRGGAWSLNPSFIRVSVRSWDMPSLLDEYDGFRCTGD